ncbi:MAG: pepsin/retropepsin-like aspartic protease family protein [Chthoniobacterales bacterium]
MQKVIVPALLLVLTCATAHSSAPLTALDAFVVSHGYGGAQFVTVENAYRIPMSANSKVGDLTIDTGSPTSIIFKASVKKFGLLPTETNEHVHGAFGKGKEKISVVTIHQLTMGNLTLMNVKAAVVSDFVGNGLRPYGLTDGLFGLREMLKYGVVLDLNNHLLLAHPGGQMKGIVDGIHSILTKQGYTPVQLSLVEEHLEVPAVVNNTPCKLIVDTGAFFTVIGREFARKARIGGYDTGLNAQGLGTNGRGIGYSHFSELKVGDFPIKNASVTISDLDAEITGGKLQAGGLLGAEYLGLHGAIFDFNSGTLYLRPEKS